MRRAEQLRGKLLRLAPGTAARAPGSSAHTSSSSRTRSCLRPPTVPSRKAAAPDSPGALRYAKRSASSAHRRRAHRGARRRPQRPRAAAPGDPRRPRGILRPAVPARAIVIARDLLPSQFLASIPRGSRASAR
jgi:hypothetical protein